MRNVCFLKISEIFYDLWGYKQRYGFGDRFFFGGNCRIFGYCCSRLYKDCCLKNIFLEIFYWGIVFFFFFGQRIIIFCMYVFLLWFENKLFFMFVVLSNDFFLRSLIVYFDILLQDFKILCKFMKEEQKIVFIFCLVCICCIIV